MPGRLDVGGAQRPLAGRGNGDDFGRRLIPQRRGFAQLGGDKFVDCARAGFGLVAERDGDLAAGHAGVGLPVAEAARIGHRGACQRYRLRGVDIGVRRRRFRAARQQHANDAQPEGHPQQKEHDFTVIPDGCSAAFELNRSRQA